MRKIGFVPIIFFLLSSCTKTGTTERYLVLKFKFNPLQERLDSVGNIVTVAAGNGAATPSFNSMSAHYVELANDSSTQLGKGIILYKAPEVTTLFDTAIDFSKSVFGADGDAFLSIPLSSIKPGTYQWLRVSLAYQNFDVPYRLDTILNGQNFNSNYIGTIASFIGFKTYIESYTIKTKSVSLNSFRPQGYWGFETIVGSGGIYYPAITKTGQAPNNATTVVNPLFASSPIPRGSCVVTAAFNQAKYNKDGTSINIVAPLIITGTEKESIIVDCSLSTNKSFEWREIVNNGMWDPLKGEQVIDMGIRGMKPIIK